MSYMLPHLHNGWQVDQAILSEEDRVVVIRFGHDWDPTCMKMDEVLYSIAEKVKNFAVIYLVDITEVPDFNKMYELYDPCTVMFFFRSILDIPIFAAWSTCSLFWCSSVALLLGTWASTWRTFTGSLPTLVAMFFHSPAAQIGFPLRCQLAFFHLSSHTHRALATIHESV
ncbi:thioredoxin-like protein 4A isoform X1 [Zonotrichia albicollis]|uniref:thioredoxin-like protein 4A isoform X1 n=1 Tax=Zonotrichia albicollis TaxID=44394 RepID=UPI003D81221F